MDNTKPFSELLEAFDQKEQRKELRRAFTQEARRLKKSVAGSINVKHLGTGTRQKVSKTIRTRVYPAKYGLGFMVTTKPFHGKGYHKNRYGKEKPVLMWAEDGTKPRYTRGRRGRKRYTGVMKAYRFMEQTEKRETGTVEQNLFEQYKKNLEKALKKKGF